MNGRREGTPPYFACEAAGLVIVKAMMNNSARNVREVRSF